MSSYSIKTAVKWLLPIICILLLAPFTPTLDLYFARVFYNGHSFYNPLFFRILFTYGELFTLFVGAVALLIAILSFLLPSLKKYRACSLAFCFTLIVGAGLITNMLFKENWGRPRPIQLIEFEGIHHYRPYYEPNFFPVDKQKSFPSGHVAMGFSFISFVLSFRRMKMRVAFYIALALTVVLGGGLTVARVAQGGHFFSDVTFSLVLIWLVALFADKIFFRNS